MADNNDLLENFRKLLDARFEEERTHTRKMVREEVAVEGERTKRADAVSFVHSDERLDSIEDRIKGVEISNTRLDQRMDGVEKGLSQANTIIAKIKTVVEITEETVNTMDEGLKEVVKDHRERIKRLEEQTSTISHKN